MSETMDYHKKLKNNNKKNQQKTKQSKEYWSKFCVT